jgi:hypothetical protein
MKREVAVPLSLLAIWWAVSVTRTQPDRSLRNPQSLAPAEPYAVNVKSKTDSVVKPQATAETAKKGRAPMASRPFAYDKELKTYLDLQAKVFMSDEEKAEKHELLSRPDLLKALGQKLLEPSRSLEGMNEQDTALDMLIEALKSGDSAVAAGVLGDVVKDGQVESSTMEQSAREQLAGLKAEILYQWSAFKPDMASNLQSMLPGPVSRRIWSNVVKMQQENLAESEAEARAMTH